MTVSINWSTYVITVPRADLTIVQLLPTEIREMDIDWFRLQLKDIEDSEEGMVFPNTHAHNTEVSLGGLTYARVVEILSPYTITFEDGQYAVNLIGANSNVGDKVNVNQVSVRSNNAAGLISTPLIEYASFNNGMTIDTINGIDATLFPAGTPIQPCKTLMNISIIARYRGFKKIYIIGDLTIVGVPPGLLVDYEFIGNGYDASLITVSNVNLLNCTFRNCQLVGTFADNSYIEIYSSDIGNISNISLDAHDSTLTGDIYLNHFDNSNFYDCTDGIPGSDAPTIHVSGCSDLGIWKYSGGLQLSDIITSGTNISVNFNSGRLVVDSSDTQGSIIVRGIGSLVGTTGGTTIGDVGLIDNASIWNNSVRTLTSAGAGGATAQEVWEYATRSLNRAVSVSGIPSTNIVQVSGTPVSIDDFGGTGSSITPADIWNYNNRTLTDGSAAGIVALSGIIEKMAPLLLGTVTGAGTDEEVYTYGGRTVKVYATSAGNVTSVVFS
jgi:hypothetical protein